MVRYRSRMVRRRRGWVDHRVQWRRIGKRDVRWGLMVVRVVVLCATSQFTAVEEARVGERFNRVWLMNKRVKAVSGLHSHADAVSPRSTTFILAGREDRDPPLM